MRKKTLFMTQAAMIASLYVILTLFANMLGLANMAIQVRFSESLTILPFFTPAAVPGLFIGCIISNLLIGSLPMDVIFGSIATLLGAIGTYVLRRNQWMAPIAPIVSNMIIIPWVLKTVYQFEGSYFYFMITVGVGELISCGFLGMLLLLSLKRYTRIFRGIE